MSNEPLINLCIFQPAPARISESFLRAHQERLPCNVTMVYHQVPAANHQANGTTSLLRRAWHKGLRVVGRGPRLSGRAQRCYDAIRRAKAHAVLAEYGQTGVYAMEACQAAGVPLVVHFHGYDSSVHNILEEFGDRYRAMFKQAAAIVAVSKAMKEKLIFLGAPAAKVHYLPYGVDCGKFAHSNPSDTPPRFLSVGRFVEKKSPHLTITAFREVYQACPEARLCMIGEGPLLGACKSLAKVWQLKDAVTFLGAQPHDVVQHHMARARCFVQHSVEASSGDCEGTPVAIMEAGASGLPVIATRHAGIPDVIVENETGLLVDEFDIEGMARAMIRLAKQPELARQLGAAARRRIESHFRIEDNIGKLWTIIKSCITAEIHTPC